VNAALWVVQALLAAAYVFSGVNHGFRPVEQTAKSAPWVAAVPRPLSRFIGAAEILGGVGLLLPALTGVQPSLVVAAAVGLALVQLLAAGFHLSRGEAKVVPVNLALLLLAAFVAYGRAVPVPLA
jgi:uncharacterized membrane protein